MAGKYSRKTQTEVKRAMQELEQGTLKSGRSGKTVKRENKRSPSAYPRQGRKALASRQDRE